MTPVHVAFCQKHGMTYMTRDELCPHCNVDCTGPAIDALVAAARHAAEALKLSRVRIQHAVGCNSRGGDACDCNIGREPIQIDAAIAAIEKALG